MCYSLWYNSPKHVELNGIINKPLLLHLVGVYIIYSAFQIYALHHLPSEIIICASFLSRQRTAEKQVFSSTYRIFPTRSLFLTEIDLNFLEITTCSILKNMMNRNI